MPLTWIAVRPQPITATKRKEETAVPAIRQSEADFNTVLRLFRSTQRGTYAIEGRGCGFPLPFCSRALKEGGNLSQFFPKFLFRGQCRLILIGGNEGAQPFESSVMAGPRNDTMPPESIKGQARKGKGETSVGSAECLHDRA
jgi:hypothetical protein